MKMKLFYASNTVRIIELETEVNTFLGTMPANRKNILGLRFNERADR